MVNRFTSIEDVIVDERFLEWFYQKGSDKGRQWLALLQEEPGLKALSDSAVQWMTAFQKEAPLAESQAETAADRLQQRLNGMQAPVRRMPNRRWWLAAAAVAVLAVMATFFWQQMNTTQAVITRYGEILEKILPDSSEVVLNGNSKISYSDCWQECDTREVWLDGEAFFHVKKTAAKNRFIVHTNQFDVIVTGTRFNVVNKEGQANVMLTEGSVTLKAKDGREWKMNPGDFVAFNNNRFETAEMQQEKVLAWRDKKLFFNNTPLRDAVKTFEAHYGINITLADSTVGEIGRAHV